MIQLVLVLVSPIGFCQLSYLSEATTIAKDAWRVGRVFERISLNQYLLHKTEKNKPQHEIVNMALKKLESYVGPASSTSLPPISRQYYFFDVACERPNM
jgi:hypothetical protein